MHLLHSTSGCHHGLIILSFFSHTKEERMGRQKAEATTPLELTTFHYYIYSTLQLYNRGR
jgi:hypothetical protein